MLRPFLNAMFRQQNTIRKTISMYAAKFLSFGRSQTYVSSDHRVIQKKLPSFCLPVNIYIFYSAVDLTKGLNMEI
jgi:hypothetical protein